MFRSAGFALVLLAGSAAAGEPLDCFNDEIDSDPRHTSTQPEALRVTDADIENMLRRIRENERRDVAEGDADGSLRISLKGDTSASD